MGFSGDQTTAWPTLQLQVETTPIAANVGFNSWSHDIGESNESVTSHGFSVLRWVFCSQVGLTAAVASKVADYMASARFRLGQAARPILRLTVAPSYSCDGCSTAPLVPSTAATAAVATASSGPSQTSRA